LNFLYLLNLFKEVIPRTKKWAVVLEANTRKKKPSTRGKRERRKKKRGERRKRSSKSMQMKVRKDFSMQMRRCAKTVTRYIPMMKIQMAKGRPKRNKMKHLVSSSINLRTIPINHEFSH
jgi:hypothetical protein